ncbi:Phytoene desaturase (lycopene-forming) [subsurface metagenome]
MREEYDVVIIGAGIGGLTCGSLLAKEGLKILVVEQASKPGGYATSYKKNGFTFDSCVHFLGGCGGKGIIRKLITNLETEEEIKFIEVQSPMGVILDNKKISLPVKDPRELEKILQRLFPQEAPQIPKYFQILRRITKEILDLVSPSFFKFLLFPIRYPHLIRYQKSTLKDLLDKYFTDPKLKNILSIAPTTLPPSKISLFFMAIVTTQGQEGFYYPQGGIQSFSNTLVKGLKKHRGELLLDTLVSKILVEKKRVCGVELTSGRRIGTKYVVSNTTLEQTFNRLVGSENLPDKYMRRIKNQKVSLPGFILHIATDLDLKSLRLSFTNAILPSDLEKEFAALNNNQMPDESSLIITIPSLVDSTLAPEGKHILSIVAPAPYSYDWQNKKEEVAKRIIKQAEKAIPNLSRHIIYQNISTPLTLEKYTLNTKGAMYGLQVTPEQFGINRISQKTPVKGLYLVGHYTRPAHGVVGVAMSGQFAAQAVLHSRES